MERFFYHVLVVALSLSLSSCKIFSSSKTNIPQSDDIVATTPTDTTSDSVATDSQTTTSDPAVTDSNNSAVTDSNNSAVNETLLMSYVVNPGNLLATKVTTISNSVFGCIPVKEESVDVSKIMQSPTYRSICEKACNETYGKIEVKPTPAVFYAICSKNRLSDNSTPSGWNIGNQALICKCKYSTCHEPYQIRQ